MADETQPLTQAELDNINKDIESAKQSLSTKSTEEIEKKIRLQLEKEFLLKQQLQEKENKAKELEQKLQDQEKKSSETLNALKSKVDELASSKAVVPNTNPLQRASSETNIVDKMSPEQIEDIEQESARAFFGPTWDRHSE